MQKIHRLIITAFILILFGCGNEKEEKKSGFTYENNSSSSNAKSTSNVKTLASQKTDLKNKGIGPISSLVLPKEIDYNLAKTGEALFKKIVQLATDLIKSLLVQLLLVL